MIDRKISTRYARALFKICEDNNIRESDALEYLRNFLNIVKSSPELSEFLRTKLVPVEKKIEVVDKLLSDKKGVFISKFLSKTLLEKLFGGESNGYFYIKEFIKYMIKRNRYIFIEEVVEIFEELVYEKENRIKAEVVSAVELDKGSMEELKKALENRFNKTIEFSFKVDESIMAGIIVKIGDVVFDGSAATYLSNLERKLLRLSL